MLGFKKRELNNNCLEPVTLSDNRFDYRFVVHSTKEHNRATRLFEKEKGTIAWLDNELKPNDVFFDVGANIGLYTIFAGARLSASGRIIAFEPHIPNANSLIENIFLNKLENKVQVVTAALTNKSGYNYFNYHSMYAAASTSQYGGNVYEGEEFKTQFVEVKHGCSIDVLCENKLIPFPDLVKIDVDGLDLEVLEGMKGIMSSSKPPRSIQIELGSDSKPKIMLLCAELGYVLKEKHWTTAGHDFIKQGNDPEDYPHYGIFYHRTYVD